MKLITRKEQTKWVKIHEVWVLKKLDQELTIQVLLDQMVIKIPFYQILSETIKMVKTQLEWEDLPLVILPPWIDHRLSLEVSVEEMYFLECQMDLKEMREYNLISNSKLNHNSHLNKCKVWDNKHYLYLYKLFLHSSSILQIKFQQLLHPL